MTRPEFIQFAEDLAGYYGRKFDAQRAVLVFPKVQHVPSEAIAWILSRITDEAETMPSNLGKAVIGGWNAWLMDNPDRRAKADAVDCPECNRGALLVQDAAGTTAVFACQVCNQAPAGWHRARRGDLFAQGWVLQPSEMAAADRKAELVRKQLPDARMDSQAETARRMRHIPEYEQGEAWAEAPF